MRPRIEPGHDPGSVSRSPHWWSRRSAASSHPATTPTTWYSLVPVTAWPRWWAERAPGEPARCCPGTTSTAPTKAPWPSWPIPAVPLRPAARRVLRILRDLGPCDIDRLVTQLPTAGRRSIRLATVAVALGELQAAGLASVNVDNQDELAGPVVGAADGAMIPCSTRLICTAPTTFATPTRPGWRTPAFRPGSSAN